MNNFNPEILGLIGGFLTCVTFLPQIYKTWKSKSVKDISVSMFLIVVLGDLVWLYYGYLIHSLSIMLTNAIVGISALVMIWMKWKYTEKG